jgi:hypothetical protein
VQGSTPIVRATDIVGTGAVSFQASNDGKLSYFGRENSAGNFFFASNVTPYSTVINAYNSTAPIIFGHSQPEVYILNGGNVGFGDSNPNTTVAILGSHVSGQGILKVRSNVAFSSGGLASIAFNDSDNTRKGMIYANSGGVKIETGASAITFSVTGASDAATIDTSGRLLVGASNAITGSKLTVEGQIATSPFIGINSSTVTTIATGISFLAVIRDRGNGQVALVLYDNNTTPIIISQTGARFTTSAPSANEIQIANLSGGSGITALSGSTIGITNVNVSVIQNQ